MIAQVMTKSLLAAVAALTVVSAVAITAAEAKHGCGKGMFFDGRSCTPKGGPGFRAVEPRFRDRGGRSFDHRGDHFSSHDHRGDHGISVGLGHGVRLHFSH
jgi:hypothetical protein